MKQTYFLSAMLSIFILSSCKKEAAPEMKPLEIAVTQVLEQDVRLESEFTG